YKRPRVQLHAKGLVLRDEVPGALIKTKKQQVCSAGELLVAEIDAKVGGYGLVPDSLDGAIVSSHYFLFTVDQARLDRTFLDYFIHTPSFREQVEAQGSTNYAAIRPAQVLEYEMPLPPLPEQQRIVARIEDCAGKIGLARTLRGQTTQEWNAFVVSLHTQLSAGRIRRLGQVVQLDEDQVPVSAVNSYPQVGIRSFGGGLFHKRAIGGSETAYR